MVARSSAPPADRAGTGPYRGASSVSAPQVDAPCPFCGNACPPLVRVCPHCDVRLDNVRCAQCYSLQPPGSFECGRCGKALELEPVLDATDAPCPRCRRPLEAAATGAWDPAHPPEPTRGEDSRVHECPRCGGMFVPPDALAEILCRAEVYGSFPEQPWESRFSPSKPRRDVGRLEEVSYIACPLCRTSMNRVNFGKQSGVIVDVCRNHGTWFDGGELTRIVAFVASGGLAKTRAREEAENKEVDRKRAAVHTELGALRAESEMDARLGTWRAFLGVLFGL